MAGMDKGHFQPGWSYTSPWAVPTKAVYLTHRRERDGDRGRETAQPPLHLSVLHLSLSLFDDRDKASEYPQRWGRVINYPVILFITFHLFPLPLLLSAACLSNARRSFKGTLGFSILFSILESSFKTIIIHECIPAQWILGKSQKKIIF